MAGHVYCISHLWLNLAQVAEYQNCRLLLVDKKISTARDMVGILEAAIRGGFPLLIMAEDIEQALPVPWLSNLYCGNIFRVFSSCKWGSLPLTRQREGLSLQGTCTAISAN